MRWVNPIQLLDVCRPCLALLTANTASTSSRFLDVERLHQASVLPDQHDCPASVGCVVDQKCYSHMRYILGLQQSNVQAAQQALCNLWRLVHCATDLGQKAKKAGHKGSAWGVRA